MVYLRAVELGLSIMDLEEMDIGFILDMFTAKINDSAEPEATMATQDDFDSF